MAVSEQTKAIIDELKNQGDLVRNSGTNSVRSVKLQMDRFEGLFNSINSNISTQTEILKMQAGIAAEAEERRKTQEQLDEVQTQAKADRENAVAADSRKTNETIDRIGDKIAKAFSFKNLLMGAAGAFAGYNLLKGFINESTDGGFDRFEDGIGNVADQLATFEMPDFKTTLDNLNTTIANMQNTIDDLKTGVEETVDKLTSWSFWIKLAIGSIGPFMAINYYLKNRLINAKIELERLRLQDTPGKGPNVDADGPTQPRAPEVDAETGKRPIGFDAEGRPTYSDTPNRPPVLDMEGRPIARAPNVMSDSPVLRTPSGSPDAPAYFSSPDGTVRTYTPDQLRNMSAPDRATVRTQTASSPEFRGQNRFTYNAEAGRFQNQGGGFASDAEVMDFMEKAVRDGRAYRNVVRVLKYVVAPAALAYECYRAYTIINSDMPTGEKVAALVGMFGGFIIGAKAATIAAVAALPAGPWAALAAGLVAGVAFGLAGELLVEAIFKWCLGTNPTGDDETRIQAQVERSAGIMGQYSDYASYISGMERLAMGGAPAFADSGYNPEMTNMSLGSYNGVDAGSISDSPYYRGNYYMGKDRQMYFQGPDGRVMRASDRPNFVEQLSSAAGNGGVTIIDGTTNVSAPVMVSDAGSSASVTNIFGEQGRGGGYSVYGLPGAIG